MKIWISQSVKHLRYVISLLGESQRFRQFLSNRTRRAMQPVRQFLDSSCYCCFDLIIKIFLLMLGKLFPSDIRYCPKFYFFMLKNGKKLSFYLRVDFDFDAQLGSSQISLLS